MRGQKCNAGHWFLSMVVSYRPWYCMDRLTHREEASIFHLTITHACGYFDADAYKFLPSYVRVLTIFGAREARQMVLRFAYIVVIYKYDRDFVQFFQCLEFLKMEQFYYAMTFIF